MNVRKSNAPRQKKSVRWLRRGLLMALLLWIGIDVFVPRKHSIRQFDPAEVARLETAMWRSYYDKKPVLLFWQLAGGLRQQFHAPFWRSFGLAFQATRAAFVFKQGHSRADYQQAIPLLNDYYDSIQELTREQFNTRQVANLELNWWIVHRQRDRYSYADLAHALAQTSAALYASPVPSFAGYARLRADAMRLCDETQHKSEPGDKRTKQPSTEAAEADWQRIERTLHQAWKNLRDVVKVADE